MAQITDTYLCPRHGPTVRVTLSNPPYIAQHLRDQGEPIPDAITGRAIIDTGADQSCIAAALARVLRLRPIDTKRILTPAGSPIEAQVYWALVAFPGSSMDARGLGVLGASLADERVLGEPIVMLIGRDLLQQAHLNYDGPRGVFTLVFETSPPRA